MDCFVSVLLRVHIFDDTTVEKMNTAVFKVFLPALIFYNIYNSSIDDMGVRIKAIRFGMINQKWHDLGTVPKSCHFSFFSEQPCKPSSVI